MINEFVKKIATYTQFENVENQYSDLFRYNSITKNNLIRYLENMLLSKPKFALVGEAPGYNGCRWSGVPFTAEKNLTFEYRKNQLFGLKNGFQVRHANKPQSEASATIVWEYLYNVNVYPLIWNAFPFHPHKPNNTQSNRKPSFAELEFGKGILEELISIYKISKIIAIGNIAQKSLLTIGINCYKVRHPANGGKKEFIKGMDEEMGIHPTNKGLIPS